MRSAARYPLLLVALALSSERDPAAGADGKGVEFFETRIRPVLVEHCYACHSAEAEKNRKLRGGLRLDTQEGIRKGGDTGPALLPGKPDESLLLAALKQKGDLKMPPRGKLPDAVVSDFDTWIRMGAPDPRDGKPAAVRSGIDIEEGRRHWAFQSPRIHPRPAVRDETWPGAELDWFILAAMEQRGLKPVRAATRREWIRRATFDLTGLPPTPEEIEAFEQDPAPDAHARVVDRLLASPHYGERWGRYWLDLARYTDDLGGTVSPVIAPNAFRYRDWVMQALNRDMPYDQFIRLQLAGDLVAEPATDHGERLAGLGFQGLGQRFSRNAVGMVKKKMADELDDRIDTVSRSLLGLTVSCARCHDHKFDPIPTRDYYSLAAAYNGAAWDGERPLASRESIEALARWEKTVADHKAQLSRLTQTEGQRIGRTELPRIGAYLLTAWKLRVLAQQRQAVNEVEAARQASLHPFFLSRWVKALTAGKPLPLMADWQTAASAAAQTVVVKDGKVEPPPELVQQTARLQRDVVEAFQELQRLERESQEKKPKPIPLSAQQQTILKVFLQNDGAIFKVAGNDVVGLLREPLRKEHDELQAELERLMKAAPPVPSKAPTVTGGGKGMTIHLRGDPDKLGDPAPPGFLQVLTPRNAVGKSSGEFTRLDLANAIASRDNPLTARVHVNRVWYHHFGRGIVGTPGNLGRLGDRPTHPELLDTLAVRFMDSGWSTKWLHREIMLSATYRLSSDTAADNLEKDADNHYLWRMTPRRLDIEAWRDAMLAVAGKLDRHLGGPPLGAGGKQLHPEEPTHGRRTVYCFISRFKPNPTLTLFDFPEPNVTSERRNVTTIPQQQLFALNSPFTLAMAKAFAERVAGEHKEDEARLRLAWRLALGRPPSADERSLALDFLRASGNAWEQLCHALLMTNEFAFVN